MHNNSFIFVSPWSNCSRCSRNIYWMISMNTNLPLNFLFSHLLLWGKIGRGRTRLELDKIDFIFLSSKITADGDCSHEIKRCLLLGRKVMTKLQFSSVPQSCPTLCDPMNCSMPGFPVHHQLPEFTQTHVHRVSDAIQTSHPLWSPFPPAPNPSQHQSLFQRANSLHEVAKVLEFQL